MAWEMVGYGASIEEGRERDISVAKQADYLAAWMRAVGLDEGALVVGHDLGGGVAQIIAVRYPELVKGLVLTNAICYDSWPIPASRPCGRWVSWSSACREEAGEAVFFLGFDSDLTKAAGQVMRTYEPDGILDGSARL